MLFLVLALFYLLIPLCSCLIDSKTYLSLGTCHILEQTICLKYKVFGRVIMAGTLRNVVVVGGSYVGVVSLSPRPVISLITALHSSRLGGD